MFDICLIGHVSWDTAVWQDRASALRPGGTVFHASMISAMLGAEVAILTAVARADADALLEPLRAAGVTVFNLPTGRTAHTRSDYLGNPINGDQLQWLVRAADPIDLAGSYLPEARAYHLCSLVHGDIEEETLDRIRASDGLIATDVKSFLFRTQANDGALIKQRPRTGIASLTGYRMTQSSASQLATLTNISNAAQGAAALSTQGVGEVVVTRQEKGAFVLADRRGHNLTIAPPGAGIDPAGLDDVFFAAYLWRRLCKDDPRDAANHAAAAASVRAESGPDATITEVQVKAALQRANE